MTGGVVEKLRSVVRVTRYNVIESIYEGGIKSNATGYCSPCCLP